MHTLQRQGSYVIHTLRARKADFFKMKVSCASNQAPARDFNPLRRSLNQAQGAAGSESNANMCAALWELMARG